MDKQNKRAQTAQPKRTAVKADKGNASRAKKSRRRDQNENAPKRGILKYILIAVGAAAVLLLVLLLVFGLEPKVVHQLPKVTPPETVEENAVETTAGESSVQITVDAPQAKTTEELLAELAEEGA